MCSSKLIAAEQGPESCTLPHCPAPLLIRSERANCFHTGLWPSGAASRDRGTKEGGGVGEIESVAALRPAQTKSSNQISNTANHLGPS